MTLAIYQYSAQEEAELRSIIYDYNKEKNCSNTILSFVELDRMIEHPDIDVYIIPLSINSYIPKDKKVIFITENPVMLMDCLTERPGSGFIRKPIAKRQVFAVLDSIRADIKKNAIMVKVPHSGIEKIELKDLNYINITNRSLRFHLQDDYIDGQCIRKSFTKEIEPYLYHKQLYFVAPSLVINLANITTVYNDCVVFKNTEKYYFPKNAKEGIINAWKDFWA